jgi:hypothetical protein
MATPRPFRSNGSVDHRQLSLPLAWYSEDGFRRVLHAQGARRIRRVRFKPNRTRIISLSRDGLSLNVHDCFRIADADAIDAVVTFIRAPRSSPEFREAVARLRLWWLAVRGTLPGSDPAVALLRGGGAGTPDQLEYLADLYRRINEERFDGRLPDPPRIRLSSKMSSRFGHVEYVWRGERRWVEEIALNIDLMLAGNEKHLFDTLVHEMAHLEAWLEHGHRHHGPVWRAIAERVGCEPTACTAVQIRRRRRGSLIPVTRIPKVDERWLRLPSRKVARTGPRRG